MDSSIYDNTVCEKFGGEEGLIRLQKKAYHEMQYGHEIEYFDQIIQGEVDGQMKQLYFHMWRTKSCGHKDCHHPLESPMPLYPYKIEFVPLP